MSLPTLAVAGAFALDALVGEPPNRLHPVAWFGRVVALVDRAWDRPRLAGLLAAAVLPTGAAVVAGGAVLALGDIDPLGALAAAILVLFVATSCRTLLGTVRRVSRLADADLPRARSELPALSGRDPADLDPVGIRSAALESLAENLADGLVAPLSAFAGGAVLAATVGVDPVGGLAVACAFAAWVKAVDTMDSMLGYPDRRRGWAAARLDDAAMWVPARLTGLVLAAWFADPGALRQAAARSGELASPNAGWPMGTLAAALAVRLEKPGHYVLNPDGVAPTHAHTRRALGRVSLAAASVYALAGVVVWS